MKTRLRRLALPLVAAVFAAGCTTETVTRDFPTIHAPESFGPKDYKILNDGRPVTGSATSKVDMFSSEWSLNPNQRWLEASSREAVRRVLEALEDAVSQCPGADALIDVSVGGQQKTEKIYLGFIFWDESFPEITTTVTGIPVKRNPQTPTP